MRGRAISRARYGQNAFTPHVSVGFDVPKHNRLAIQCHRRRARLMTGGAPQQSPCRYFQQQLCRPVYCVHGSNGSAWTLGIRASSVVCSLDEIVRIIALCSVRISIICLSERNATVPWDFTTAPRMTFVCAADESCMSRYYAAVDRGLYDGTWILPSGDASRVNSPQSDLLCKS